MCIRDSLLLAVLLRAVGRRLLRSVGGRKAEHGRVRLQCADDVGFAEDAVLFGVLRNNLLERQALLASLRA
eukprot:6308409-Alexandrium_andersonii.AAC.1